MQTTPDLPALSRHSVAARIVLLEGAHSGEIVDALHSTGCDLMASPLALVKTSQMRNVLSAADIVLVDLSARNYDILQTLNAIYGVIGICNPRPRVLCFSTVRRNPHVVLSVEQRGARYARISSAPILLEAVDLLLAEMNALKNNGPCFQILHRFSQGSCAPGEEISAVFLATAGRLLQLPLGLVQRFVFDFLAQRRIALDSLQIVSGLSGDWFYREHASNSGRRQPKKIRRATVKVHVQRIREAMASTFAKAQLRLDPYEILRSIPAEGSKRSLYKLHADVTWHHENG